MSVTTILIIILILMLAGAFPVYRGNFGGPWPIAYALLVILLIFVLLGRI